MIGALFVTIRQWWGITTDGWPKNRQSHFQVGDRCSAFSGLVGQTAALTAWCQRNQRKARGAVCGGWETIGTLATDLIPDCTIDAAWPRASATLTNVIWAPLTLSWDANTHPVDRNTCYAMSTNWGNFEPISNPGGGSQFSCIYFVCYPISPTFVVISMIFCYWKRDKDLKSSSEKASVVVPLEFDENIPCISAWGWQIRGWMLVTYCLTPTIHRLFCG